MRLCAGAVINPGTFHLLCPEGGEVAVVATEFRSGVTACRIVGHVGAAYGRRLHYGTERFASAPRKP